MDSSRVLVALEEQEKWRERRARLQARLRDIQRRKRLTQRELDEARARLSELEGADVSPVNPPSPSVDYPGPINPVR